MERYYFYIDYDNSQKGPMTLDNLMNQKISRATLIWHEELPSWVEAGSIDEIAERFNEIEAATPPTPPTPPPPTPPLDDNRDHLFDRYKTSNDKSRESLRQPKTWLIESLIATFLCCMPLGIISLIFSLLSSDAWNNNDYEKARRYSNRSGMWFKITIIITIIIIPLIVIILFNLALLPLFLIPNL